MTSKKHDRSTLLICGTSRCNNYLHIQFFQSACFQKKFQHFYFTKLIFGLHSRQLFIFLSLQYFILQDLYLVAKQQLKKKVNFLESNLRSLFLPFFTATRISVKRVRNNIFSFNSHSFISQVRKSGVGKIPNNLPILMF